MTARMNHKPIPMVRRLDPETIEAVGEFAWRVDPQTLKRTLILAIPCINSRGWIRSEWTIDHPNASGAKWSWTGTEGCPTLHPSLHAVGVWHGWVRDGKLVEA